MEPFEFYFSDLTEDAQSRYLEFLKVHNAEEANLDMNVIPIFEIYSDEVVEIQEELFPENAAYYANKEWNVEEFKENKNRWQLSQDKSSMFMMTRIGHEYPAV